MDIDYNEIRKLSIKSKNEAMERDLREICNKMENAIKTAAKYGLFTTTVDYSGKFDKEVMAKLRKEFVGFTFSRTGTYIFCYWS